MLLHGALETWVKISERERFDKSWKRMLRNDDTLVKRILAAGEWGICLF